MGPTDWGALLQTIAGPALGALIALVGVSVNQLMQRATQDRTRHHDEVRDLAAEMLRLAEELWRRGWHTYQEFAVELKSNEFAPPADPVHQKLVDNRVVAMKKQDEVYQQVHSVQRRLMLTSPALDEVAAELIAGANLFPPPLERPSEEEYARREKTEQKFIDAVRKRLGTPKPRR